MNDDDEVGVYVDQEVVNQPSGWSKAFSFVLDVIPIVGTLKSAVQVVTGYDVITGEPVNRVMELVGVVPWGKVASKGLSVGSKVIGKGVSNNASKELGKEIVSNLKLPKTIKEGADVKQMAAHLERKKNDLLNAIEKGHIGPPTIVTKAERQQVQNKFRNNLTKNLENRFGQNGKYPDKEKLNRLLDELKKRDIDHKIELQLGGKNDPSNLRTLNSSINRSSGAQINNSGLKDCMYFIFDFYLTYLIFLNY
jgi:hypothetical protein